jgi:hypothetical protein
MFTKVEVLEMSDIQKNTWDEFLNKYTMSTVFHTQEWMKTLQEAYGYEPKYLAGMNDDDSFVAVIPFMIDIRFGIKNYLSMPFDTYGGVVGAFNTHRSLVEEFMNLPGIGVRWYVDFSGVSDGDIIETEILEMSKSRDSNILWNDVIRKTNRTAVKSALKHNVTIRESKNFVTIFDKVPQILVDSIVRNMIPSGLAKIYLAEIEGQIVAASIFFFYNDMVMYWANTTTELGRKTNANYLLLWTVIKYARDELDYRRFNFGASPQNADSLVQFKKSWGTETYKYVKFQKIPALLYPLYTIKQVFHV